MKHANIFTRLAQRADPNISILDAAMAEIAEQEAFIHQLADMCESHERQILKTNTAMSERIKELEADAARYRWLRDNKAQNNTHCWHFQNGPIIPGLLTLDTAIDAALKAASILDSSFPHSLDKASALGGGNVSEGIRKALSGS